MNIRPVTADDRRALDEFVASIPAADVAFLDRTLLSQIAVAAWTQAVPERRLIAVDDGGSVAAIVTIAPGVGWTSHVGEVRLVVRPSARGQGVGRQLAIRGLELATSLGLTKATVEIVATNAAGLAIFRALGFTDEALLRGQVRATDGTYNDLILLSRWLTPEGAPPPAT